MFVKARRIALQRDQPLIDSGGDRGAGLLEGGGEAEIHDGVSFAFTLSMPKINATAKRCHIRWNVILVLAR